MAIRELGYRPFEGTRRPPSRNLFVLLRRFLVDGWRAWPVKVALLLCWAPALIVIVLTVLHYLATQEIGSFDNVEGLKPSRWLHTLVIWELWIFVGMVTVGAGATAIGRDLNEGALTYFFSKPVTPNDYVIARMLAVMVWCLVVMWLPALAANAAMIGLAPEGMMFSRVALLLPTTIICILVSAVCAVLSVSMSSLSSKPTVGVSAWAVLFVVPAILANIVSGSIQQTWSMFASIPSLLESCSQAMFGLNTDINPWIAGILLFALCSAAFTWTVIRVKKIGGTE